MEAQAERTKAPSRCTHTALWFNVSGGEHGQGVGEPLPRTLLYHFGGLCVAESE